MKHIKDYTGQKFNRLTSVRFDRRENKETYWLFLCDCGNEKILRIQDVKNGKTKSCGCVKRYEDLTGQKFERYTFIKFNRIEDDVTYWLCKCDCGIEKIVKASSIKSGATKSCGCYGKWKMSGENNHGYRHDLTQKDREENKNRSYNPKNKKWRGKVFARDGCMCQICGTKDRTIQAHHIYSWRSHKKLRYVTSNGVTLCKNCHKKFHKEYGYGNNTRKQFTAFKNTYAHINGELLWLTQS